jgi:hypothetical protein
MHQKVTHNTCYAICREFREKSITFLTADVPKYWHTLRDRISDNFLIINPLEFRVPRKFGYSLRLHVFFPHVGSEVI